MAWWKSAKTNKNSEKENLAPLNKTNPSVTRSALSIFEEFSPKNYEDVEIIADVLISQKSVKLNLKDAVISDRRRILDFLLGIAYAFNFKVKRIDIDVYEFELKRSKLN